MNRKEIEKRYSKILKGIEDSEMYDGRGTVDRYICEECGYMLHTTYKDKGVTPFTMACPKCGKTMYHEQTFRKKDLAVEYLDVKKWYRPTLKKTLHMSEGSIEHILNGGLILER